jgi:hypothetical protein
VTAVSEALSIPEEKMSWYVIQLYEPEVALKE